MTVDSGAVYRGTPAAEAARREYEAALPEPPERSVLDAEWLRDLCTSSGAADAGFVEIDRAGLGAEGDHARRLFPATKTLICLIGVSNRESVRSVSRPTANKAWHHTCDQLDHAAATICERLGEVGVRAMPTNIGFPFDMDAEGGRTFWEIAHKTVAVEAGMGHMGLHRNVIHPRFGNFVLLDTVLIDATVDRYNEPLDYNPCAGCNLCVAACPVGAVHKDGEFDFFACLGHNYREFMSGFTDWVDTLSADGGPAAYRAKFRDNETLSMWQSLAFEPNYKSAYCMAVCPAGDDVIPSWLADKRRHRDEVVVPLLRKPEPIYVQSGTRAEKVASRNPSKRVRYLDFKPDLSSVGNFAVGLRHMFTPPAASDVPFAVAFSFPDGMLTARVADGAIETTDGAADDVDATVTCSDPDYIRILHRPAPGRPDRLAVDVNVDGDRSTFDRLLASLA